MKTVLQFELKLYPLLQRYENTFKGLHEYFKLNVQMLFKC